MNRMRCMIVDDEPFALAILADDISKIGSLELVKTCRSAYEVIRILEYISVDLIFLDIQMPGLSGLQLLSELKNPPLVIFTTAFEQFAVTAFDLNALDYLLKPISFKRLVTAVDRAYALRQLKSEGNKTADTSDKGTLYVKSEYQTVKIQFEDILYVEGMKDYVKIFTESRANPVLTRMNVKGIQSILPEDLFCRVHQSYIISINKVEAFQRKRLWIAQKEIPVGDRFSYEYQKLFEQRLGKQNI